MGTLWSSHFHYEVYTVNVSQDLEIHYGDIRHHLSVMFNMITYNGKSKKNKRVLGPKSQYKL